MDCDRRAADSHEKYERFLTILGEKTKFYDVESRDTYNMDEKGFSVGAMGKQKSIFSRRLFDKKQFRRQQFQGCNREWQASLHACVAMVNHSLQTLSMPPTPRASGTPGWRTVKVGERIAFFGVSTTGWSNNALGLSLLHSSFTVVDCGSALSDRINFLAVLPVEPPSIYVDLQGTNLSRQGTISILQLYVQPKDHTCLVDVHRFQHQVFSTTGTISDKCLKTILEAKDTPEVFFDVRNDSDALFHHFQISLSGVDDI